MEKAALASQLWSVCMAISAFCIAQTLAFAYGLKDKTFADQVREGHIGIKIAILLATSLYASAVFAINALQSDLTSDTAVLGVIEVMRNFEIGAIVVSGGGALFLCHALDPDGQVARALFPDAAARLKAAQKAEAKITS